MDKQDAQTGLRVKYDVKKVETGKTVNNCFVLRPDKDPAAVAALRTYAWVTPNKALADDIMAWIGADTADKPRLAEVLGVEEDEEWTFPGRKEAYRAHNGILESKLKSPGPGAPGWPWTKYGYEEVCNIINHPESIIRAPRLTEPEIAIMRAVGAKWVSKADGAPVWAELWDVEPKKTSVGLYHTPGVAPIAKTKAELFPSVKPGDLLEVTG